MKYYHQFTKIFSLLALAFFAMLSALYLAGLRFNTTKSIPLGVYWASSESIKKGSYVMFCPPEKPVFLEAKKRGYLTTGFCDGQLGYMMKKVLAVKLDHISVEETGVYVNSKRLNLSKPRQTDGAGRIMPRYLGEYTLKQGELLLMSDISSTSFDGRYFGPVQESQIKTVIKPVYTWGK